jgi:hypothetical protein
VVQEIKNGVIPMYDEVATVIATQKKQLTQNEDKRLTETAQEKFDEDAHRLKKLIKSYAFLLKQNNKQRRTVLSHRQAGIAALVNCSWNGFANVEAILVNNQIAYRAIRDILPGEEILIDYGCDYTDSLEFLHIFPIGSRSIDLFLKQNAEHYPSPHQSITLDKTEQALLGTQATHVLVPHYCSDLKKLKSLSDTEINLLPIIEMVKSTTGDQLIPLPSQQFMTGLMYACLKPELREHQALFDKLIQKEMCVDFVTTNGRSAWHILTARYDNTRHINKMCMKLSTAIYHLYDKRGWTNAYLPYLRKNLKETSLENQEAIFSASLIPPKKTHSKRINLTQEDSQPKTNPSVVVETLITIETSQLDKSPLLPETKLDDVQVSHSISSTQLEVNLYHSVDEKMIVKTKPEVTPHFTDDEKMRKPFETKQAGFSSHIEIATGIEPPSKLKRSDSIPILEAVRPTENKSIILPIIKPQDYLALTTEPKIESKKVKRKRKSRDCIDLTSEPVMKKPTSESLELTQKEIKTKIGMENKYINISFMENELKFGAIGRTLQKFNLNIDFVLLELKRGFTLAAFLIINKQMQCLDSILRGFSSTGEKIAFIHAPCSTENLQGYTALTIALIEDNIPLNDDNEYDAMMTIFENIPIQEIFNLASPPLETGFHKGWTPIAVAAWFNKSDNVEYLLDVCNEACKPTQMFALLNTYPLEGETRGLNSVAIAVKYNKYLTFVAMLKWIIENQIVNLLFEPQMEGSEARLTIFDIAIKYHNSHTKLILLTLLQEVICFNPLYLTHKPQSTGEFQGCSLLAIAVILQIFPAIRAIENIKNMEQRAAVITDPQAAGPYLGMTALSIALKKENMEAFNLLLEVSGSEILSILTLPQPAGVFQGLDLITIVTYFSNPLTIEPLCNAIGKANLLTLLTLPRGGEKEKSTPFDLAILSNRLPFILPILKIIPPALKFSLVSSVHSGGRFLGCTNFAIAVFYKQFSIVKEMLKDHNMQQNFALITTPQYGGPLAGLTAISIAVKQWNFDLLSLLLSYLPLAERLPILHFKTPQGEEKGLSAFDIAVKYKKSEGLSELIGRLRPIINFREHLRPLEKKPQTPSIVQTQSVSFNFSNQVTTTPNSTTALSTCLLLTQRKITMTKP